MIDIQKDVFSATDIGLVRKANEDSLAHTPLTMIKKESDSNEFA
jgi:hypothetical protein